MAIRETIRRLFINSKFQTVYLILLITVIPIVIVLNSVLIIDEFKGTFDIELQRKAFLTSKVLDVTQAFDLNDVEDIQRKIELIAEEGDEFQAIDVLVPEGQQYRVVASLEPELIGVKYTKTPLDLAWQQEDGIGYQTNSRSAIAVEPDVGFSVNSERRFWVISKSLSGESGEREALIAMKLSSKIIDELIGEVLSKSYMFLGVTVLLVLAVIAAVSQIFKAVYSLKQQVGELDTIKDNFLTVTSHIMRTPLSSMRWNLEMLLSGDLGELEKDHQEYVRQIYKSNLNILRTVQNLMTAMEIEKSTLQFKPEETNLKDLVDSVLIDLKQMIVAKELVVDFQVEEGKGAITADPKLLKEAIYAVLDNAMRYSDDQGKVEIVLKEDVGPLVLVVKDQGMGIAKDEEKNIFKKFYRGSKAIKMYTDGAGLGLSITKHIMEAHDGEISFESEEGKGSTFSLEF